MASRAGLGARVRGGSWRRYRRGLRCGDGDRAALGSSATRSRRGGRGKVYFDSSHTADALLRSAENHVKAGDFAEAIDIYQRVTQQFGDKVVEVAGDPRLSINARRESQRRIAALPAEARALYRARVDAQAERWYRQGLEGRDRGLLRRVVDQAFCSSWGDDALDLLGDLAFQEGQFAEALAAYTQLLPDRGRRGGLAHPDPSVDLTRVAAKKLLCRAAIGEHPPTPAELAAFAQAHPADSTSFAGRRGPIARDLAEAVQNDHLGPPAQADGRWPTFAGAPTRDRIAPGPIDVGSLQWQVDLEPVDGLGGTVGAMQGRDGQRGDPAARPPPGLPPDHRRRSGPGRQRPPDHRVRPERPAGRAGHGGRVAAGARLEDPRAGDPPRAPVVEAACRGTP